MRVLNNMLIVDETFAIFLDETVSKMHGCRNKRTVDVDLVSVEQCHDDYVPKDYDCLRSLIETYETHCGKFDDYSRKFIKYLVRECEQPKMSQAEAKIKLQKAC